MKISVAMTRDVIVIAPDVTVGIAKRLMERWHIRHIPVVREGRLVGILSDRDVLKYEAILDFGTGVRVGEAMTVAPVTCGPSDSVGHVAQLMVEHKIDSVPIIDTKGGLAGLVTTSDLLSLLIERTGAELLPFDYRLRFGDQDGMYAESTS